MSFQFEQGEILLVNKPYTWTSFDVVGKIRSLLRSTLGIRKIKIGHAGTLDPLASGLLIICTGKFTKRIDEFQGLEKEYAGTFSLGTTTPSFDRETEADKTFSLDAITEARILQAAEHFTGTFDQIPPAFSAMKIDGKRAYDYARKEIEINIKPRKVTISLFEITAIRLPEVDFRVVCSKGTYIRSLARDMGLYLECGAHLASLCRTRIGSYFLRDAWEIDALHARLVESAGEK